MNSRDYRYNNTPDSEQAVRSDLQAVLAAGTALAAPPRHHDPEVKPYVLLPHGFHAEQLEVIELPRRKAGTVKLNDAASFVDYFGVHKTVEKGATNIYASLEPLRFLAVFNDHSQKSPNFRDHRALYSVAHSTEYETWEGSNGKGHAFQGTVAFAEFIENNAPDIIRPSGADMLQMALSFRVNESVQFSQASRLDNGDIDFAYRNVVEGQAKNAAGNKMRIPEQFEIEIPVFEGPSAKRYKFEARFRYRLRDGHLTIWYELQRPHKVVEKAFTDLRAEIEKGTGTKILFGSPE